MKTLAILRQLHSIEPSLSVKDLAPHLSTEVDYGHLLTRL